jgi:hypothetical protein
VLTRRSPVKARNPSTRTVERNSRCAAWSAIGVSTVVMIGIRRATRRDTVGWEQPNNSAISACDRLWRGYSRTTRTAVRAENPAAGRVQVAGGVDVEDEPVDLIAGRARHSFYPRRPVGED